VLAAARPPLGADARWAAVAAVGIVTAALAWTILKALDRRPPRRARPISRPRTSRRRRRSACARPIPIPTPLSLCRFAPAAISASRSTWSRSRPMPKRRSRKTRLRRNRLPSWSRSRSRKFFRPSSSLRSRSPKASPDEEEPALEPEPEGADSITSLMQRFESGLSRKQQAIRRDEPPAPVAPIAPIAPIAPAAPVAEAEAAPPSEEPERSVGHRLRSAIAGLQKVSAAGG
jgi:hypothetical protein